uniref:Synembryn-A n=1 Tax=Aceria tosichella TaxID=561515 RepID=A0A6G1SGY8_9ACAR
MTQSSSLIEDSRRTLEELYDDQSDRSSSRTIELLSQFRVFTREKTLPPDILNDKCLKLLISHSSEGQTEAQKCLSNLILNYAHVREHLVEPYVDCAERRLKKVLDEASARTGDSIKNDDKPDHQQQQREVLYYDLRIIFLLSALCPGSRGSIRDRLLSSLLKVTLAEAEQFRKENYLLVIESLKTLFNLTMDKCFDTDFAANVIIKLFSYVGTSIETDAAEDNGSKCEHTDQLLVNLIHLLTNMPEEVYRKLSDEDVDKVLRHLDDQLKTFTKNSFRDTVLPVLNTCANICRYKEDVRQRWFQEIIGSTKDFEKRPEEYDTLRGRLVKLMTSVDIHIKDIAAEFLHALCGGDTEKFITYTGFGNSAAFLSTKGLLSQNPMRSISTAEDDNKVEEQSNVDKEYQELRGKLDPITGRLEQPKRDPMEGMTEEEKEWHAHELAGAIAKLSNLGVIKPMQVGPDGQFSELKPKESNNGDYTRKEDEDSD